MAWAWTALFNVLQKLLNILSWPSFTVICPLYASFWAIKSGSVSKNQQCLTFWVLFASITVLEQPLTKLFGWLSFWPYLKGVATVLLVIPYFSGASYVYKHFVRPYLSEYPQIWNILLIPRKKCFSFCWQNKFVDAANTDITEDEQEDLETFIYQEIFEPKYDNAESKHTLSASPKKVQKEWSCALCLVSTTSEKCLKKHLQGKKHKAEDKKLRAEELSLKVSHNSSSMSKRQKGMVLLGNLVNFEKWSGFLSPVTKSIRWCRWQKPDFGWIKLNTDGSVDPQNAGFGGLIRDYKGDAICAFVSKASGDDIFLVELWAIWRGLVLALGLGIKVLWVESDSMSVVRTINRKQRYSGKANSCLKHIRMLLKKFDNYKVAHSWRETNRAADYLAKMVLEKNDVVLWPDDFPSSLWKIIKDDAEGRTYCRGNLRLHNSTNMRK